MGNLREAGDDLLYSSRTRDRAHVVGPTGHILPALGDPENPRLIAQCSEVLLLFQLAAAKQP